MKKQVIPNKKRPAVTGGVMSVDKEPLGQYGVVLTAPKPSEAVNILTGHENVHTWVKLGLVLGEDQNRLRSPTPHARYNVHRQDNGTENGKFS